MGSLSMCLMSSTRVIIKNVCCGHKSKFDLKFRAYFVLAEYLNYSVVCLTNIFCIYGLSLHIFGEYIF